MSAYIVSKRHIDALVAAAASVEHGHNNSGMSWVNVDDATWQTLDYEGRCAARVEIRYSDRERASEVGMMLWAENLASIEARYPDTSESGMYPGPCDFTSESVLTYRHKAPAGTFNPVGILKALAGYEYQTCEHPGWLTSEARSFCEALRDKMIRNLPGYNEAAWEIDEVSV